MNPNTLFKYDLGQLPWYRRIRLHDGDHESYLPPSKLSYDHKQDGLGLPGRYRAQDPLRPHGSKEEIQSGIIHSLRRHPRPGGVTPFKKLASSRRSH